MNLFTNKNIIILFLLIGIFTALIFIPANAKSNEEIYQEKLDKLKPDDVKGHYDLGEWCLKNKLEEQAKTEFNKVMELNPNHEGARKKLGHVKYKDKWQTPEELTAQGVVNYKGKWMTLDESMKAQGYVKFEYQWVTPKEEKFIKDLVKKFGAYKDILDNPGADSEDLPWEKAREKETDHFIIKTNLSADALNDICVLLECAYFNYQDAFSCEQPKGQKLRVIIANNKDEYQKIFHVLTGTFPPPSYCGLMLPSSDYRNKSGLDYVFSFYEPSAFVTLTSTLLHECNHYALTLVRKTYNRNMLPIWLHEGWAAYYASSRLEKNKLITNVINQSFLPIINDAIQKQTFIKIKEVINLSLKEYITPLHYASGWSLVYFLMNGQSEKYKKGLFAYMDEWKKGKITTDGGELGDCYVQDKSANLKIFEKCMGVPIDQLEKEWKEYILQLK